MWVQLMGLLRLAEEDVILTAMSSLSPSCRHSAQIGARFCGDGRADLRKLEHSFDRVTVNLIGT